jgi:hypothetical protein
MHLYGNVYNVGKTVLDRLKGIAFADDCPVSASFVERHVHQLQINGLLIAIVRITTESKRLIYS